MKMSTGIVLLVLALGVTGCGEPGSSSVPLSPSPVSEPSTPRPPPQLVVFADPASEFSTSDVHDVQQQVVRFNTAGELVWTADETRYSGYPVSGNFVGEDHYYQVRFATRDGGRRAYLCGHGHDDDSDPPSLCDIEVVDARLVITETAAVCPPVRE